MKLRQAGYLQELNRDAGQQNIKFCQIQRVINHINSHGRGMYLPMLMKNFTLFLNFFFFSFQKPSCVSGAPGRRVRQ